jgi:hypothetical protein
MTIEQMAQAVIDIDARDEAVLLDTDQTETAAFEEYASEYEVQALRMVCKGCHGG